MYRYYRYFLTKRTPAPGAFPPNPGNVYSYGQNGASFDRLGQVWGYVEYETELGPGDYEAYELTPAGQTPPYFSVSEEAARAAKNANSWSDYVPGSVTAEYRRSVDEAAYIAYTQKKRVDPMYHDRIDYLLTLYSSKLAQNYDSDNRNRASVPSVMISGAGNFPVRKKEKQNARADKIMAEYEDIQGLVSKIKSTGTGGIRSDDQNAVEKLEAKLAKREALQQHMKAVNAYYRKHKTLNGCPELTEEQKASIEKGWENGWYKGTPYPPYELSNNNAEIRRLKGRLEELKKLQDEPAPEGWEFDGGEVRMNKDIGRIQILFDEKPDAGTRDELKSNGFRWAPSQQAWQRQLTENGIRAVQRLSCVQSAGAAVNNS